MENEKPELTSEHYHQIEEIFKHGGSTADRILSYAKLRIDANDRLLLLSSGMLTLTFSGMVTLASRPNLHLGQDATRPLLWAWKFLILSVICCLLANSREGQAASIHDSDLLAFELWGRNLLLFLSLNKLGANPQLPIPKQPTGTENGRIQEAVGGWFGLIARLAVVVAFICLYRFAKVALLMLNQ